MEILILIHANLFLILIHADLFLIIIQVPYLNTCYLYPILIHGDLTPGEGSSPIYYYQEEFFACCTKTYMAMFLLAKSLAYAKLSLYILRNISLLFL